MIYESLESQSRSVLYEEGQRSLKTLTQNLQNVSAAIAGFGITQSKKKYVYNPKPYDYVHVYMYMYMYIQQRFRYVWKRGPNWLNNG